MKILTMEEISKKVAKASSDSYLIKVGENVKSLRIKNKLTQEDVAFFIFTNKSMISALERGAYNNITIGTLARLAELFKVPIQELLI